MDASQSNADLVTNAELRAASAELRAEIAELRSEMRTEFAKVRAEIATVRTEIATTANRIILWSIGVNIALYGAMFAMMAKGFHWY